jgi:hypothetical protein
MMVGTDTHLEDVEDSRTWWGPETFAGAAASVLILSIMVAFRVAGNITAIFFISLLCLGILAFLFGGRTRKFGVGVLIGECFVPAVPFIFWTGFIAAAIVDGTVHPGQY